MSRSQRHTHLSTRNRETDRNLRKEKKISPDCNRGNRSRKWILLLLREGSFEFCSPTTKNWTLLSFQNELCRAPRHKSRIELTLIVLLLSKLLQIRLPKNFCLPSILSTSKKPSAICWGKTVKPWIQSPPTLATHTTQAGRGDLTDTGKFPWGSLSGSCLPVSCWVQVLKRLQCDMQQVTGYCLLSVCLSHLFTSLSQFSFCPPFHLSFVC